MDTSILAISGSHIACYRFHVDMTGKEADEITLTFNAGGLNAAINMLESDGYRFDQVLGYTVC